MEGEVERFRPVLVAGPDHALICALAEHRPARDGWIVRPLDGPPHADALVILDFSDSEEQTRTLGAIRGGGFVGPVMIVGGRDDAPLFPADEPMPRPVRLGVLLGRIDAHCKASQDDEMVMLGPYQFLPDERLLHDPADGRVVRLTELEQDLLLYLIAADGALIGREQLLAEVWGYSEGVDSHTVETHIWRLRQKIETDDPATRFLLTEAGGYRLLAGGAPG